MKKIVMIGTHFNTMGGISSVVNVYRAGGLFDEYDIVYLATHRDGGAGAKLAIMLGSLWVLMAMLLRRQVGLLHIHVSSRFSFWRKALFFLPSHLCGVPIILHLHGSEFAIFYENESGPVRKWLIRSLFNRASRVVVLSATWQAWVRSMCSNPSVLAIYNPVMLPELPTDWERRQAGRVLFLGRLGKRKGTYDLLDALALLRGRCPELKLLLGGDGEIEQVARRAEQLQVVDQVSLLGWVSGADRGAHLASAKIYCLPSYNEGLPMSVLEAMAAGLPILSTPIGGIPEAVTDGVEGFLVPAGDIQALSDRLALLLGDDAAARRMGAAARHKVETTFSSQAVLPAVGQLYQELGMGKRISA